MSGGHWNYMGGPLRDMLEEIGGDADVRERFPLISTALLGREHDEVGGLAQVLYDVEHVLDWDFSADSHIHDDRVFEREALWRLLRAVMIAAPDEWFPRGKW